MRCHNVTSTFPEWHVSMALLWERQISFNLPLISTSLELSRKAYKEIWVWCRVVGSNINTCFPFPVKPRLKHLEEQKLGASNDIYTSENRHRSILNEPRLQTSVLRAPQESAVYMTLSAIAIVVMCSWYSHIAAALLFAESIIYGPKFRISHLKPPTDLHPVTPRIWLLCNNPTRNS